MKKIAKAGQFLKNSFLAILKGEFILRLKAEKYILQILYTFVLIAGVIWISILIDNTLLKVEKNSKTINELEIAYSERCYEKAASERRSNVAARLSRMGSKVGEPEKSAIIVER